VAFENEQEPKSLRFGRSHGKPLCSDCRHLFEEDNKRKQSAALPHLSSSNRGHL